MKTLFKRICAQKIRALRVAALAFSAGVLFYLGHPGHVGAIPVPVFTGILYAAFITPAAVVMAALLPALTTLSDAMQWSRLTFASLVATFPALRPLADAPLISATAIIALGSALVWLKAKRKDRSFTPFLTAA